MLGHSSISLYYRNLFAMVQRHKYSITELENLIVFERDLYIDMLIDLIEEEKTKEQ